MRIRESLQTPWRIALGAAFVLIVLVLWVAVTWGIPEERLISAIILPSPLEVVLGARALVTEGGLLQGIFASLIRVLTGFLMAIALALPVGIGMGAFGKVRAFFEPTFTFLSYLPVPALIPLTLALFGTGEMQKILFLALSFIIFLIPLVVKAMDEVDQVYLNTAYTLGAKPWTALSRVMLPIALPRIVHAMRLGFGVGWTYIMLAEIVDAQAGLGHIITVAQRRGHPEFTYLTLVVIVGIAFLTDKMWAWLYDSLFPYLRAR